ncbi:hypothetical protein COS64_04780 [archaeon CG06_land_8_20_14_3_00_37_11]|nr:MAG: hypothetical protein COS64_04780 [archaeon CG06_land_8_20_14_3_00_37_11]
MAEQVSLEKQLDILKELTTDIREAKIYNSDNKTEQSKYMCECVCDCDGRCDCVCDCDRGCDCFVCDSGYFSDKK